MESLGERLVAMVSLSARIGRENEATIDYELRPEFLRIHVRTTTDDAVRQASYDQGYGNLTMAGLELAIGAALFRLRA